MDRFVDVPGGRLFVADDGDARPGRAPLVFAHSTLLDHHAWDALVPLVVDAGFRAIRYDIRGWGASEGSPDAAFRDCDDVVAILDALQIDRAVLAGNSRGGTIAIDTTVEHPARVAALVAIACDISGYEPPPNPVVAALDAEYERIAAGTDPDAEIEFELRLWVDGPGQPADRVDPAIREFVRQGILAHRPRPRMTSRIPLEPPANERLDAISCPVLAVAGELDIPDCLAAARRLAEAVPDGRVEVVRGVAHLVGVEAPERLATMIVDFLTLPMPGSARNADRRPPRRGPCRGDCR